jgi:hypothetical protein
MSPTVRTLDLLRASGYLAETVEKWLPRINRRRDLFHVGDVLAVHPHRRPGFLLVQATTRAHVQARLDKARGRPELAVWLRAGGAFEVWGWFRRGKRWEVLQVALEGTDRQTVPLTQITRRSRKPRQRELFNGELGITDHKINQPTLDAPETG